MKDYDISSRAHYDCLRPQKAALVKRLHARALRERDDLTVAAYDNAVILPLRGSREEDAFWGLGGVADADGAFVEASKIPHLTDRGYPVTDPPFENQTVVYAGFFRRHWGELIAYCLPRLWYAARHDDENTVYVFFVRENEDFTPAGNYRLLLERLGILDRVRFINRPTRFARVLVPELSYNKDLAYYSQAYLDIFRKIHDNALPCQTAPAEKIFFTRSQLKKSRSMESGVDFLDAFFRQNGYRVIAPETVTLDEMIACIDNARTIACISGTLPHNLLFAKNQAQGKQLVIVERNALFNFFQPDTDKMLRCDVTYVDANITLYPVELSYGPFVYAWNPYCARFAETNGMQPPDAYFLSEKCKKKLFQGYIKAYRQEHGLCLYMPDWLEPYHEVLFEGYREGERYFEDYLRGRRCYRPGQVFSLPFLKRIVKKVLRRG